MPESDRQRLHCDLTRIIATSGLIGYGYAIDLAGCRAVAPSVIMNFPDMHYYDCFVKLSDCATQFIPRDRVDFTFDRHQRTQYNAGLLFRWITAHKPEIVGEVSFRSRKEPGIQAADLWARELMKRCDTHMFDDRAHARLQWSILASTHRFHFQFTLGRELGHTLGEVAELPGFDHPAYERWCEKQKVRDNLSNRFRYASGIDIEEGS